jgi:hypothetical protein
MVKNARLFLSVILLATLPIPGWGQDAKAILTTTIKAMGTENLRSVQYSGSGSTYDEKGQHSLMPSYSRQMDLNAVTSAVRMVVAHGTPSAQQTINQTIAADSPWNVQFDFWLTPYGFLKGAMANDATAETKAVDGATYKIVTFTLPGNHKVVGYINDKDLVERVEVRTDDDVLIQAVYHDYQDFGGLKVPTILAQKRRGELALVVIIKDAKSNTQGL